MTESPNTEARDLATAKESARHGYNREALDEARVEALLATVREAREFADRRSASWRAVSANHEALQHIRALCAALDAIASELELHRIELHHANAKRAAAEAELERVRAERDLLREEGDVMLAQLRSDQARLDKAVAALREAPIAECVGIGCSCPRCAALAEMEESG